MASIVDLKLARNSEDDYFIIMLEPQGSQAARIGVAEYLAQKEQGSRPQPSVTIGNLVNGPATHMTTGPVVQGSSLRNTHFGSNAATNTTTTTTYHQEHKKTKNDTVRQIAIGVVLLVISWAVKWWWTGEPF